MKRFFAMLLCVGMLVSALAVSGAAEGATGEKLSVYASFYPMYDFASKIGGDRVEVTNMVPSGMEPHDWEPTPADIVGLEKADVFVYNGAGMEHWVEDVLAALGNEELVVVEASEGVFLLEGHGHGHDHESFTEADVEDRTIADFAGEWQSIYPYMLDGTLDEALEHAAEEGDMTVEELSEYYKSGFETDIDRLVVEGNSMTFHTAEGETTITYEYDGFVFLNYEDMDAQSALYRFKAVGDVDGALKYVLFADHNHEAGPAEHFHLNFSEDGNITTEQTLEKFATYFPASFTGAQIAEEMAAHGASEDHEDEDDHEDDHDHGAFDPHVWLSPMNAKIEMENIKNALVKADPADAETYEANYAAFAAELDALDQAFKDALTPLENKDIVVAHQAFGYLCAAYGLNQVAIEGLSPDSEPDPARVAEIIEFGKEHDVKVIFFEELVSPKVAESIASAIGADTDVLSPIEGLSDEQQAAGDDYFSVMRGNLEALKAALQ